MATLHILDIIDECNLHQLVNVPTRKERTLDLILVTNPSIINKVHTLPPLGLSDHDVVYTEADIWLRKILRYDKANWDNIKFDLEDTLKKIININNDAKSTVNEMWNLFKNKLFV
jgi:hypothetical protein